MVMYETILVDRMDRVAVITLNRPESFNALNFQMMSEITALAIKLDRDPSIGAILVTGSPTVFAVGADIKEMIKNSFADVSGRDWFSEWSTLNTIRKPLIAAVSGYALGGGCELAMMCDMIIASTTAKFGQPEIKLGVIPGMGGSQRLTRAVGKAKAMDMCLTGRTMDAAEAERMGLVSRTAEPAELHDEALKLAHQVASMSMPSTMLLKEAVNRAYETSLSEGLLFERRAFHSTFATADQSEGMSAFLEKRQAQFVHR